MSVGRLHRCRDEFTVRERDSNPYFRSATRFANQIGRLSVIESTLNTPGLKSSRGIAVQGVAPFLFRVGTFPKSAHEPKGGHAYEAARECAGGVPFSVENRERSFR